MSFPKQAGFKKRILIISAFYSPKIHVASNRAVAMAKYLKKAGFEVTVLSEFSGPELVSESLDQGIRVFYLSGLHWLNRESFLSRSFFPIHQIKVLKNKILNFFLADDNPGFFYRFKHQMDSLASNQRIDLNKFDIILSTYAPLSSHLIGLEIKKRFPRVTWVADFRDEMSFLPIGNFFLKNKLKKMESKIIEACDIVSTISKPLLEQFKSTSPISEKKIFIEVRNGFDFQLHQSSEVQREVFKITYTGTFYGLRNPILFFEALKKFVKKYPLQNVSFDIYGGSRAEAIPKELERIVIYHEKIKYERIREKLIDSSVLLLIEPSMGRVGGYTGKIFDYLAVNRPILAYIKQNDVADELISLCKAGYVNRYYQVDEVFKTLDQLYQDWLKNQIPDRNWVEVKKQSRENQINKLIEALNLFGVNK